ncbi:ABC transporter permease [Bacillus ndiopicus]|uniref:ABC transporter permease n=1 Tax=Bacillus ndiopicus TaxID=1347368 RepID=UPI0005A62300|nr:ABC transporter permease [Bacillus ndiopicus]
MLNLMRLEFQKHKLATLIKGSVIAYLVILAFITLITIEAKSRGEFAFKDYNELFIIINTIVRGTFIVYAATLIAKFVIEEFKNKTITVLFMYPISRKKIIMAKLTIITIFTFININLANLFLSGIIVMLSNVYDLIPGTLTALSIFDNSIKILMHSFAATGMSLIPLFFGMRKFSVPTTIISSLIIVLIVCSNNGDASLNNIIFIPITLGIIGVYIAYLAIRKIDKVDLI